MDNHARRAALALFAMHREDRAWIFARLDTSARKRLETLVREVERLGFSRESVDLTALLREERRGTSAEALHCLSQATPRQMEHLQEKYGAELVTVMGDLGDFPWKNAGTQRASGGTVPSEEAIAEWVRGIPQKSFDALVAIACEELAPGGQNSY